VFAFGVKRGGFDQDMKKLFYDLLRPVYKPILKPLRRRLGRVNYYEHPEMELPKVYDAIQLEVERRLHHYLHCDPNDIRRIAIVGANKGDEIERLALSYPNAAYDCFEPSPRFLPELRRRWSANPKVTIHDVALAQTKGKARFYELSMPGNGSLLEPDIERWSSFTEWKDKSTEFFEVETRQMDEYYQTNSPDLLWMDVQGGEMSVLLGGNETLKKTKAIFLEMTLVQGPYKGCALFSELNDLITSHGFTCCGQGIDPWNFSGVALWIKDIENKICKEHPDRKR
jgi:FkbM family methyltransferase